MLESLPEARGPFQGQLNISGNSDGTCPANTTETLMALAREKDAASLPLGGELSLSADEEACNLTLYVLPGMRPGTLPARLLGCAPDSGSEKIPAQGAVNTLIGLIGLALKA